MFGRREIELLRGVERIAVIGCPGVGKSTFSRRLSQILNLPLVHLDMYYWDITKPYYKGGDKECWLAVVKDLTRKPKWIIDGNYKSSFGARFSRSDVIVFLDYSRHVRIWRILKRRWQFREGASKTRVGLDMPQGWREKVDWPFMKTVWNYRSEQIPIIMKEIDAHGKCSRLITVKSDTQLRNLMTALIVPR